MKIPIFFNSLGSNCNTVIYSFTRHLADIIHMTMTIPMTYWICIGLATSSPSFRQDFIQRGCPLPAYVFSLHSRRMWLHKWGSHIWLSDYSKKNLMYGKEKLSKCYAKLSLSRGGIKVPGTQVVTTILYVHVSISVRWNLAVWSDIWLSCLLHNTHMKKSTCLSVCLSMVYMSRKAHAQPTFKTLFCYRRKWSE